MILIDDRLQKYVSEGMKRANRKALWIKFAPIALIVCVAVPSFIRASYLSARNTALEYAANDISFNEGDNNLDCNERENFMESFRLFGKPWYQIFGNVKNHRENIF